MDISEVVRYTGVPASTLRFYEKKGLIQAISPAGERRHFSLDILDQLALIAPPIEKAQNTSRSI